MKTARDGLQYGCVAYRCAERAIGRHGIDVRRWDIQASIETDISITQVIR